jgi:hypothetical protein
VSLFFWCLGHIHRCIAVFVDRSWLFDVGDILRFWFLRTFLDHVPSIEVDLESKSGFSLDTTHDGRDVVIPRHEHGDYHLLSCC